VPKTFQNDTFYVIALGEQILNNGLDRIDHFSWHDTLEYRYPHWLFDVVNSAINSSFGLTRNLCFCMHTSKLIYVNPILDFTKK
jgi:hypothetical protein